MDEAVGETPLVEPDLGMEPTDTVVIRLADRGDRYPDRELWADFR